MRIQYLGFSPLVAALMVSLAGAQDIVVTSGETADFDTTGGRVVVDNLTIEEGGVLRARGPLPMLLVVRNTLRVDGTLDLSGYDAPGVLTLNTTNVPEFGAPGGPAAGRGGVGSALTTASTPAGGQGFGSFQALDAGGFGGETGYLFDSQNQRRAAGGGGGALAADQPVPGAPLFSQANRGLIAHPGSGGAPTALGALTNSLQPAGGEAGPRAFVDADLDNDFWGCKFVNNQVVSGEILRPVAGAGGGAGGDAVQSNTFPLMPFVPHGDEKGAGGGGGGGLGILVASRVAVGPVGQILAEGGNGGSGENVLFFDHIGGASGGGSGGFLIVEALLFDFSQVQGEALSARGGVGGAGAFNHYPAAGSGGPGGPGVIQLHTPSGTAAEILLPAQGLDAISAPNAQVLLPNFL